MTSAIMDYHDWSNWVTKQRVHSRVHLLSLSYPRPGLQSNSKLAEKRVSRETSDNDLLFFFFKSNLLSAGAYDLPCLTRFFQNLHSRLKPNLDSPGIFYVLCSQTIDPRWKSWSCKIGYFRRREHAYRLLQLLMDGIRNRCHKSD